MKTNEYIALEDQYGAKNYTPLDVVRCKGEGIWVWDADGNKGYGNIKIHQIECGIFVRFQGELIGAY